MARRKVQLTNELADIVQFCLKVSERNARADSQSVGSGVHDILVHARQIDIDGILHGRESRLASMRTASSIESEVVLIGSFDLFMSAKARGMLSETNNVLNIRVNRRLDCNNESRRLPS